MEPTLTPPDPADDPLDALLRAAPPSIPDEGFTARVCAALPLRETRPSQAVRRLILTVATLLGCALAWQGISHADLSFPDWMAAAMPRGMSGYWFSWPLAIVFALWGAFAVSRPDAADGVFGGS